MAPETRVEERPTAILDRRERKKNQTRRRLQLATLRMAAAHGLAGVTTEQIADAADVSPRTFFNYFPSKEAALMAAEPGRDERLRASLVARPADESPVASLRVIMVDLAAELVERREEWQMRAALVRENPELLAASFASWNQLERALALGVADRAGLDVVADVYPALLVGVMVSAMRTVTLRWGAGDGDATLPDLVAEAIDAIGAGLPVPARRDRTPHG
ncbi:MAG: TetR family transcriptional regulator [Actinomycetota bacterium]|nr:TetR family transcriptional regulator [Actinomycetota bacterium]